MDMTGEYRIPASRDQVWAALNDPATLKASLPGCESLEKVSEHAFAATVVAKVGPVKAKFNGNVSLSNLNPPESYTISGEGKGGAAGFAKGGADVRLAEDGDVTVLTYTAKADVGGKLAQLGSRLIDGTAKKMADEFFDNFSKQVAPPALAPEVAAEPVPAPAPAAPRESLVQNKFVWAAAAIVVLMILVLLLR
jgi:carbon monoxide dehydrogenase subunit G